MLNTTQEKSRILASRRFKPRILRKIAKAVPPIRLS